jgi:hypothetical protein
LSICIFPESNFYQIFTAPHSSSSLFEFAAMFLDLDEGPQKHSLVLKLFPFIVECYKPVQSTAGSHTPAQSDARVLLDRSHKITFNPLTGAQQDWHSGILLTSKDPKVQAAEMRRYKKLVATDNKHLSRALRLSEDLWTDRDGRFWLATDELERAALRTQFVKTLLDSDTVASGSGLRGDSATDAVIYSLDTTEFHGRRVTPGMCMKDDGTWPPTYVIGTLPFDATVDKDQEDQIVATLEMWLSETDHDNHDPISGGEMCGSDVIKDIFLMLDKRAKDLRSLPSKNAHSEWQHRQRHYGRWRRRRSCRERARSRATGGS